MTEIAVNAKRIVVVEHPKSGGSWFVNLLGDIFALPKRDIYVSDGFNLFDLTRHPWYENARSFGLTKSCVIKSHELPESKLHNFPAFLIHLMRDGRDVVVSKYFYEKDFCVKNGIYDKFDVGFDDYVGKVSGEWRNFVDAWLTSGTMSVKYEDLRKNTSLVLYEVAREVGQSVLPKEVQEAIEKNSVTRMRTSWGRAFGHNTFVRKALVGDWRTYFSDRNKEVFKMNAGDLLVRLGYEKDNNW